MPNTSINQMEIHAASQNAKPAVSAEQDRSSLGV
jgi:hypothetical protein